ncbi:sugar-phosphatase [Jeotgalibaca caeni]|uniref:sugar-phosphatase n=1 Tax=Jeotgalibaca caeni TaxID=3028623 RepID=UPI00237D3E2F|nr:sugar-phosphatase [Jeotgalibaca caeni]MDE1548035.1 sugar-phosphatase [Jeotgalibaca caeni]
MIKLIALDLDGTLLNSEKQISDRNKAVIQQAKEKGIKVVLCTGRPLGGIKQYLEELNLLEDGDYSITYNGGLVQNNRTGEVLSQKTLSYEQVKEIYACSQELSVPMNMIDLEYVYEPAYPAGHDSLYPSLLSSSLPFVKRNMDTFSADHVFNKVVFCTAPDRLDEAIARIPDSMKQRYSMMKSRPLLFEIMHPEVDKGNGISVLCDLLGYTNDDVMACGDEENDLAMLQFAGFPVAMDNASDELKSHATFITKTNNEDGVAYAIEQLALKD